MGRRNLWFYKGTVFLMATAWVRTLRRNYSNSAYVCIGGNVWHIIMLKSGKNNNSLNGLGLRVFEFACEFGSPRASGQGNSGQGRTCAVLGCGKCASAPGPAAAGSTADAGHPVQAGSRCAATVPAHRA